jgi:hypothetical protein
MTNSTIFDSVWAAAKQADIYHPNRTVQSIFNHAQSEMGEIALEINIADGQSYKAPGSDGIVGESLDAIAAILDLIYKVNPDFPKEEYLQATNPKRHTHSKSMFSGTRKQIDTIHGFFNQAQAEMGKVALEINIFNGEQPSHKAQSLISAPLEVASLEAVASLLDLIYKVNPDFTEAELVAILEPKMKKWIEKIAEHQKELK